MIASGIHTLALCWGSWVSLGHLAYESAGGLAVEDVQFAQPVRPGDVLRVRGEVTTLRRTQKGKWLFVLSFVGCQDDGRPVITFRSVGLLEAGGSVRG